jgi:hypothetical protein
MEKNLLEAIEELKNLEGSNEDVLIKTVYTLLDKKDSIKNILVVWLKLTEVLLKVNYPSEVLLKAICFMDFKLRKL